jgi:hypothetical protein
MIDYYVIRNDREMIVAECNDLDFARLRAIRYASVNGACTVFHNDLIAVSRYEGSQS